MNEENRTDPQGEPVAVTSEDFVELDTTIQEDTVAAEEAAVVGQVAGMEDAAARTFDELTEETSVIDASFVSPAIPAEVEEVAEEIENLAGEPVEEIIPEGEAAVAEAAPVEEMSAADAETTGIIRKSLFDPVSATPQESQMTEQIDVLGLQSGLVTETQVVEQQVSPFQTTSESDATILEGATILPELPSRAPSRWLSALAFLLLTPIAWYLLADSGGRFLIADGSPWVTGRLNLAALGELTGGIAVLILLGIVAANSSLGLYLSGVVFTVLGTPFLFVPGQTTQILSDYINPSLTPLGGLGSNIAYYLEFTGATGILFTAGITLIIGGWVVTHVRRKGRAEESLRVEVAEVNPGGLHARWARKSSRTS